MVDDNPNTGNNNTGNNNTGNTGNNLNKPMTKLRRIKSACAATIQRNSAEKNEKAVNKRPMSQRLPLPFNPNEKKEIGKKGFLKKWLGIPNISYHK
jgi:hypothetical protein